VLTGLSSAMRVLLAEALVDHVNEGYVLTVAHSLGGPIREAQTVATNLISEMLGSGLFVAGDLTEGSFSMWPGEPRDWVERINHTWAAWGPEVPTPGSVVWFDLSIEGDAVARSLDS
jgi:hypothetical protein